MAGRVVLLKAVIDSTPIYLLSLYKLPATVLAKVDRLRRDFLWGDNPFQRKMHFISWDRICKHKHEGGLGISSLKTRNNLLLAK